MVHSKKQYASFSNIRCYLLIGLHQPSRYFNIIDRIFGFFTGATGWIFALSRMVREKAKKKKTDNIIASYFTDEIDHQTHN